MCHFFSTFNECFIKQTAACRLVTWKVAGANDVPIERRSTFRRKHFPLNDNRVNQLIDDLFRWSVSATWSAGATSGTRRDLAEVIVSHDESNGANTLEVMKQRGLPRDKL